MVQLQVSGTFLLAAVVLSSLMACSSGAPTVDAPANAETARAAGSADLAITLQNPSFVASASGLLDGWIHSEHGSGHSYTFEADTAIFHSGPSAARIQRHGPELYGMLSQAIPVDPSWVGRTLRVSAYVRSEGLDTVGAGGGALTIRADRVGGGHAGQNFMLEDRLKGDNKWRQIQVEFLVPVYAGSLRVGAMLQGGGTLWVDDFEAEVVR